MADIVSAISGVFQCFTPCFKSLASHAGYVSKFDENLNKLRIALRDLEAKRNDVVRQVDDEELRGRVRLDGVEIWLSKVRPTTENANKLVNDASVVQQTRSTSGCYCNNITSTYRCGKKITKMLSEVRKLYSEQDSQVLTRQATLPVVVEVEGPTQQIVGFDTKLASTWSLLMDEGTRMLGLYGMGGVGKTTLLTLICNKFVEVEDKFDVVIWVDVSKDVDILKIQDDIGKRLGLDDEKWCKETQRGKSLDIRRVLKEKKPRFVLLLDDLWKGVSLSAIGIPLRGKEYKIVFTTRHKDVCAKMGGGIYREVECLAEKDALDLLTQISGRDSSTEHLAEEIARKCYGLPLALHVIGKCLSSKTTEDEWLKVLEDLCSSPDLVEGMEKNMFDVLKVSYDNLEEEDARSCFLYCALFPMAYSIHEGELVEYWIGEGIIEVRRGRDRAKTRGAQIINTLVRAGLLLKDDESNPKVYMHNMIREMALWIVSEIRDGQMFLVKTDAGLRTLPCVRDWTIVSKMSLMNNDIQGIPDDPEFPDQARLMTLFLQNNKLVEIGCRFFVVIDSGRFGFIF